MSAPTAPAATTAAATTAAAAAPASTPRSATALHLVTASVDLASTLLRFGAELHSVGTTTASLVSVAAGDVVIYDIRQRPEEAGLLDAAGLRGRGAAVVLVAEAVPGARWLAWDPDGVITPRISPEQFAIARAAAAARHLRHARRTSRYLWKAAADRALREAVLVVDREGRLRYMNPTAEAFTGTSFGASEGRPLGEVLTTVDAATGAPAPLPIAEVLALGEPLAGKGRFAVRDGEERPRPVSQRLTPVRSLVGDVIGVAVTLRDDEEIDQRGARGRVEDFEDPTALILAVAPLVRRGAIHVRSGGRGWSMFIDAGRIVALDHEPRSGPEDDSRLALREMLRIERGSFACDPEALPERVTMDVDPTALLLELASLNDESDRDAA